MIINIVRRPDFYVETESIFEYMRKNAFLEDNQDLAFTLTDKNGEMREKLSLLDVTIYAGNKELIIDRKAEEWEEYDIENNYEKKERLLLFDFDGDKSEFNKELKSYFSEDDYRSIMEMLLDLFANKNEVLYTRSA